MNDQQFEQWLKSQTPASTASAETVFYRAGWNAALSHTQEVTETDSPTQIAAKVEASSHGERKLGWHRSSFPAGIAAGLALGLVVGLSWTMVRSDRGSSQDRVADTTLSSANSHQLSVRESKSPAAGDRTGDRTWETREIPSHLDRLAGLVRFWSARPPVALGPLPDRSATGFLATRERLLMGDGLDEVMIPTRREPFREPAAAPPVLRANSLQLEGLL